MALRKRHIIIGALALADLAMTAAVFAKVCLPSLEELTDAAVERAMEEDDDVAYHFDCRPIGFDETPEEDESAAAFDRAYDEVMRRATSTNSRRRDPIDEGIDNILRYEVNGKTGLEREDE